MRPLTAIALSLSSLTYVKGINLYQDQSDLPAGVTAASACGKALNASIACDTSLGQAVAGESLQVATLTTLCLKSYRTSIASACGTSVVIQGKDAAFPITYEVDNLIYSYNTTCTKDATTGAWCSPLFNSSWPGTTKDTAIQTLDASILCTSCNLQNILLTQQSVFGYDPTFVSNAWPTIQSKCKITTSITDPGQAYVNITEPDPGPTTCLSGKTYTVKSGDTCQAIAVAQTVGTNDLISINRNNICVSAPGGYFTPKPVGSAIPTGTLITTATPAPTGTAPGAPTNCGRWYIVQPGETCNTIILSQGITMADFKAANPQINADCTNLWALEYNDNGALPSGDGILVSTLNAPTWRRDRLTVSGETPLAQQLLLPPAHPHLHSQFRRDL
ncbi:hypothetical protein FRC07_000344 [Ceratobasidium sp. 392]|nr:hypothetical protein FRC07_000344 [Ceratobasidium sp. 392]